MKGLKNLGNTCYFNACLQCLFQAPALSNPFLLKPYEGKCEFTQEYCELLRQFWFDKTKKVLDPSKLLGIFRKKFKQFDNQEEQDAQECMLCVIDLLEKARPSLKSVLYGTIEKKVIYPGGKSITEEKFAVLMLTPQKGMKLEELLKEHFKQEVLTDYEDDDGKTHHCAVLDQRVTKWPTILIVGFNMFSRKFVMEIPEKFQNYKLFSACTHLGSTRQGHYLAHTKHRGTWYLKDDDMVRKDVPVPTNGTFYFSLFKLTNSSI